MKRKKRWWGKVGWVTIVATTVMLLRVALGGPVPVQSSKNNPGKEHSEEIPFTLVDGYLIAVEGRIGAHRHLKLVLDTGSTNSVLRSGLGDGQWFVRRTTRIVNLEQVLTQDLAEVPDFELGALRIAHLSMMLNDLTHLESARHRWNYRIGRAAFAKFQHRF